MYQILSKIFKFRRMFIRKFQRNLISIFMKLSKILINLRIERDSEKNFRKCWWNIGKIWKNKKSNEKCAEFWENNKISRKFCKIFSNCSKLFPQVCMRFPHSNIPSSFKISTNCLFTIFLQSARNNFIIIKKLFEFLPKFPISPELISNFVETSR